RDPAGVYPRQDFNTRDRTRHVVETVSKRARIDEEAVVDAALKLAVESRALPERNVGYWLIGPGLSRLETRVGATPSWATRLARRVKGSLTVYLGGIASIAFLLCVFAGLVTGAHGWWWLVVLAAGLIP